MKSHHILPGHMRPAAGALLASAALAMLMVVSTTAPSMAAPSKGAEELAAPRMGSVPGTRLPDEVKIPMAESMAPNRGPLVPGEVGPGRAPCPHPFLQTLTAAGSNRNPADFPAAWNGHFASGLSDPNANKIFGYTFQSKWPDPQRACCEVVGAVVTITVKCINDIPENDAWAIMHNGAGVAGAGGAIGWPSGCNGQTKTISWTATPAVLAMMNANPAGPSLSFAVEDDTQVTSATLQISECCVQHHEVKPGSM